MVEETVPTTHPWLAQFPPAVQALVAAWFGYAVSQGARTPEAILKIVERLAARKLDWSILPETRSACRCTLLAIAHQRPGARCYAQTLLTRAEAHA